MDFGIVITLPPSDVTSIAELIIYVVAGLMIASMVLRPMVRRLFHGVREPLTPVSPGQHEEEEPLQPGLVKVAVWVPEANAAHVQLLAKQLRKNGGLTQNGEKTEEDE